MSSVSFRPQTSQPAWQPVQHTQRPEQTPGTPENKPVGEAQPQPQPRVELHKEDTFEAAPASSQSQSQGFSSAGRSVQQPTDISCGLGALATVNSASKAGLSDEQLLASVQDNARAINDAQGQGGLKPVDLADGTNPQEMSQLLGQQGQEVVRGFGQFDSDALKDATKEGYKGMMLVDANALENTQAAGEKKAEGQGALHWITIDDIQETQGADGKKEPVYSVKDPDSNKDYTLSRDQMEHIVNQAKNGVHQTGGGLLVKNRPDVDTQEEKNALSAANLNHTAPETLGIDDGIGRDGRRGALSSITGE